MQLLQFIVLIDILGDNTQTKGERINVVETPFFFSCFYRVTMKYVKLAICLILFCASLVLIYQHLVGIETFSLKNIKTLMAISYLITSIGFYFSNIKSSKKRAD